MKVLAPIDFSPITQETLKLLKLLEEKKGAKVTLLNVVEPKLLNLYPESLPFGTVEVEELESLNRVLLKRAEEELKKYPYPSKVRLGNVVEEILLELERENYELLVLGSHRRGVLERLLVGSTTQKLLNLSKVPTFVVKGKFLGLDKVLISYDFSKNSTKFIKFIKIFFKNLTKKLVIFHLFEKIDLPIEEDILLKLHRSLEDEKLKHLSQLVRELSEEFEVELTLKKGGKVPQELLRVCEEKGCSLLALNYRKESKLLPFLGSTTTKVVETSPLPLLIFKG